MLWTFLRFDNKYYEELSVKEIKSPTTLHRTRFTSVRIALILLAACLPASLMAAPLPSEHQRILYLRGDFSDVSIGISDEAWLSRLSSIHTELDQYWGTHSYGRIKSFTAEYTEAFTFTGNSTDYFNLDTARMLMWDQATQAGYDLSTYDHIVLSYPRIDHNEDAGAWGVFGNIWLPGDEPSASGLIHESGHSFGLHHAGAIEGAPGVVYPGEEREGRDGLFMMGSDSPGRIGDFSTINLPMRYELNLIGDNYIHRAESDGTYRIWEFELDNLPSVRTLGVRVDVNGADFWVSFDPKMVDRWALYDSAGFANGIIVHKKSGTKTDILDFTPGSYSGAPGEEDYIDVRDGGALQVGSFYQFPNSRVSFRPVQIGVENGIRYIDVEITTDDSYKARVLPSILHYLN